MDFAFLSKTPLFAGCTAEETASLLTCVRHRVQAFPKGRCVYRNGDLVQDVCVVLSGAVQIESVDVFGNKSILGFAGAGDIFAEAYACLPDQPILVDVFTQEKTEILFINVQTLLSEGIAGTPGAKLVGNLLQITARKNLRLSMRIFHTSPKTIRARLSSYFSEQIALQGSHDIRIPLDRQQLADYLGVDRTALSKELSKMRDEGLITYRKNTFRLNLE